MFCAAHFIRISRAWLEEGLDFLTLRRVISSHKSVLQLKWLPWKSAVKGGARSVSCPALHGVWVQRGRWERLKHEAMLVSHFHKEQRLGQRRGAANIGGGQRMWWAIRVSQDTPHLLLHTAVFGIRLQASTQVLSGALTPPTYLLLALSTLSLCDWWPDDICTCLSAVHPSISLSLRSATSPSAGSLVWGFLLRLLFVLRHALLRHVLTRSCQFIRLFVSVSPFISPPLHSVWLSRSAFAYQHLLSANTPPRSQGLAQSKPDEKYCVLVDVCLCSLVCVCVCACARVWKKQNCRRMQHVCLHSSSVWVCWHLCSCPLSFLEKLLKYCKV